MRDCGFTEKEGWFRYRACAIIIKNGNVLVAKNSRDPYYYSVGGGVHLHETTQDAVVRETFEETGVHFEVDRLAFIHENFFSENGRKCHEIAFYFLMKPNESEVISPVGTTSDGISEQVVWLPINELDKYILYPSFYKDSLLNIGKEVRHIVTKE